MAADSMIQVTVAGMILDQQTRGPVLLLHIPPLDRYLPIWIGPSEAASIGMVLKNEKFERPLTHDLLVTIIDGLEGKVSKVIVTDQRDNTFFAKIFLERGQQVIGIDARPSDSIAIAVRTRAPIFVARNVIEREKNHLLSLDEDAMRGIYGTAAGSVADEDEPADPDEASDESGEKPEEDDKA